MAGAEFSATELKAIYLALAYLFARANIIALWCIAIIKIIKGRQDNE